MLSLYFLVLYPCFFGENFTIFFNSSFFSALSFEHLSAFFSFNTPCDPDGRSCSFQSLTLSLVVPSTLHTLLIVAPLLSDIIE